MVYVGKIYDSRKRIKVEWKIPAYYALKQKIDFSYESPTFSFLDKLWNLIIYPNGKRKNDSVGWINLYLKLDHEDSSDTTTVAVKLGIKNKFKELMRGPYDFIFTEKKKKHGWNFLLKNMDLHQLKGIYITNNVLTVTCEAGAACLADTASQTSQDGITLLSRHFSDLLKSGWKSDVVIQVPGRKFQAHKLVLGTRSPVFAAMFEHDMKENKDDVKIVDCEPDTFQKFLEYMYTGEIGNISCYKVVDLLDTADKYSMAELKEICMEFVKKNLSAETACEAILVADRHNEIELRQSAKKLILQNFKKIVLTDQWKKLLVENYSLSLDLLGEVIPNN